MLKKGRVVLALIFWTIITLLFLDFTGSVHVWFGWMAKVQFLPALLALNVGVVVVLVLLTLLLGRIYCSVICPLGVFQDIVSRFNHKKNRFTYSPAIRWARYGGLWVFIIAFIAGVGSFVSPLLPYSAYFRILSNLFVPIYHCGDTRLADFAVGGVM